MAVVPARTSSTEGENKDGALNTLERISIIKSTLPVFPNYDTPAPVCGTLQELIRQLHIVSAYDDINIEYMHELMASYKSNPAEWRKFAKFDRLRYTRNLVDEGNGKFNLMVLCWGEGHASVIHDHSDSHCFMKMLHGKLREIRFAWPDESDKDDVTKGLDELSRTHLDTNEVCYMNDSLGLHRVENVSHSETAVSLHLYYPPFSSCSSFNERTGQRSKCTVTFWSKHGKKTTPEIRKLQDS